MKILIIKTSSLGDVIHTLPAITEASKRFLFDVDWVVEKSFANVPIWHPKVKTVIPVELRKFKRP